MPSAENFAMLLQVNICNVCVTKIERSMRKSEKTFKCTVCGEKRQMPLKELQVDKKLDELLVKSPPQLKISDEQLEKEFSPLGLLAEEIQLKNNNGESNTLIYMSRSLAL